MFWKTTEEMAMPIVLPVPLKAYKAEVVLSVVTQIVRLVSLFIISTFNLTSCTLKSIQSFFLLGLGYSGMLTVLLCAVLSAVDLQYQSNA